MIAIYHYFHFTGITASLRDISISSRKSTGSAFRGDASDDTQRLYLSFALFSKIICAPTRHRLPSTPIHFAALIEIPHAVITQGARSSQLLARIGLMRTRHRRLRRAGKRAGYTIDYRRIWDYAAPAGEGRLIYRLPCFLGMLSFIEKVITSPRVATPPAFRIFPKRHYCSRPTSSPVVSFIYLAATAQCRREEVATARAGQHGRAGFVRLSILSTGRQLIAGPDRACVSLYSLLLD